LIAPGTCPQERVRDQARTTGATTGAALRALGGERGTLTLTADWMVTDVRVDTRGLTSGNVLTGDKALWGPLIGVAAEWVPAARIPLGLEVEVGVGFLMPVIHDEVEDGYTPFDGGLAVRRLRVGFTWQPWQG
jgi:hypothetical protein